MDCKIINYFIIIFFVSNLAYATTQPKFTLTPITPTTISLQSIDVKTVKYIVTNKTKITRTLTMEQIQGVSQNTSLSGACANPFTLATNQSCTLVLNISGSTSPNLFNAGPKICKTINEQNNTPDPFLCSQPSLNNTLNVTVLPTASITSSPKLLVLSADSGIGTIRVTNNSTSITANNISAQISDTVLEYNVIQDASSCKTLAPGKYCDIIFTVASDANDVSATKFAISGTNTTKTQATIKIVKADVAFIEVTNSPLILQGTTQGFLTIQNTTNVEATNISASGVPSNIEQVSSNCSTLAAYGTCTLYFTSLDGLSILPTLVSITGTTASTTGAVIAVNGTTYVLNIASGSPLNLIAGGTAGSIVVKNDSLFSLYNIAADFSNTALYGKVSQTGSTCPEGLAPGAECTLSFTPGTTSAVATNFPITGTNADGSASATVDGVISISYPNYYVYARGSTSITRCAIDTSTGLITNPSTCINANSDGTLSISSGSRTAFAVDQVDNYFYIVLEDKNITRCVISTTTGMLSSCSAYSTGLTLNVPNGIAINQNPTYGEKFLYYIDGSLSYIYGCYINTTDGALYGCGQFYSSNLSPENITVNNYGTYAYVSSFDSDGVTYGIYKCTLSNGIITTCGSFVQSQYPPFGLVLNLNNSYLYNSTYKATALYRYLISSSSGSLSTRTTYDDALNATNTGGIAINRNDTYLFVMGQNYYLYQCPLDTSGSIGTCFEATNGSITFATTNSVSLWNP
jgi:hypothetical protein